MSKIKITELSGTHPLIVYSEEVTHANLVIGVYQDNAIRILKNSLSGQTGYVDRNQAIDIMARIISKNVFGENNLRMFQSGLEQEISKSIKNTINRFHTKGGK
jgi:hypothetical protein